MHGITQIKLEKQIEKFNEFEVIQLSSREDCFLNLAYYNINSLLSIPCLLDYQLYNI